MNKILTNIKEYICSKRMLYMLCFVGLMFIDWSRGSQVGSTWAWTVNLTGVVMAVILFSLVPFKDFIKPVYGIYSLLCIIALPVSYYWWTTHQEWIYRDKLLTAVLNVWVLGLLVIRFGIRLFRKEQKIRLSLLQVLAILCLIWMTVSVNEDVWPIWYLSMFFLFWQTPVDEKTRSELLWGMLDGIVVSFFAIQGLAFVFRPFDDVRYPGMYSNTNMNSLFYLIVLMAFLSRLFLLRYEKKLRGRIVFCWLFSAAMVAFILYTMCRTAMITAAVLLFIYALTADLILLKDKAGPVFGRICLFGVTILIAMLVEYFPMRYLPPVFHHPIWYEGEWRDYKVQSSDPVDSWKYQSFLFELEQLAEKFGIHIQLYDEYHKYVPFLTLRVFAEEYPVYTTSGERMGESLSDTGLLHTGNESLDGRQLIYKYYLSKCNLLGHPLKDSQFRIGESFYVWHAQNALVQVLFLYGLPAGLLYILIFLILLRTCLRMLRQGEVKEGMVLLLFLVLRFVFGQMEVTWYPGQMVLFLLFFLPKFMQKDAPLYFDGK